MPKDARTTTDRIAAVERHGDPITPQERADALSLLDDLLATAERHGVTLEDFDWVTGLPDACVDVIRSRARKRRREGIENA